MTFMTVMMNYSYIPFMNRYFTPGKVAVANWSSPFQETGPRAQAMC